MKRAEDNSEGNVFVRLKEEFENNFAASKKLFASKKIIGMSLNELKEFNVEDL
jgi:hypothetical protein